MKHPSLYPFDGLNPHSSLAIVSPGNLEDMLAYSRFYKEKGVPYIFDPGQSIPAWGPAELVEMATGALVLDPTGAGDAYRAGLIKGLCLKLPWATAAQMGATIASFAVEQQGTQEHRLTLQDFWQRYQENFGPPPAAAVS